MSHEQSATLSAKAVQVSGAVVRGTVWSLAMRWSIRLIGMLSVLILARLLTPADYGVMAMATLTIGLVQVFLDASADTALLRHPSPSTEIAHSCWSIRLIQSGFIAVVVALSAPLAAAYFREPRVEWAMWVLSVGFVISGLSSMGPVLARREFDFALEVKIGVASKILSFLVTVGAALLWRNYWALVLGQLTGQIAATLLSYLWHPYRARWSTAHMRELWGFSQWLLLSGIANYIGTKLDEFIAGRVGTPQDLGRYRLASELGLMVSVELGTPLNRALLPVLSSMQSDLPRMRSALMSTVGMVNSLTLPAGIGLAMLAERVVPVMLGPQWVEAAPLLRLFAAMGAIRFIVGPYYTLFMSEGRSRLLAMMAWLDVAVFCVCVWPALKEFGFIGLAYARFVSLLAAVGFWLVLGHCNGLRIGRLVKEVWRPALGTALMAAVLAAVSDIVLPAGPVLDLLAHVALGAACYAVWMLVSWLLCGRPAGLESRLLAILQKVFRRPGPQ